MPEKPKGLRQLQPKPRSSEQRSSNGVQKAQRPTHHLDRSNRIPATFMGPPPFDADPYADRLPTPHTDDTEASPGPDAGSDTQQNRAMALFAHVDRAHSNTNTPGPNTYMEDDVEPEPEGDESAESNQQPSKQKDFIDIQIENYNASHVGSTTINTGMLHIQDQGSQGNFDGKIHLRGFSAGKDVCINHGSRFMSKAAFAVNKNDGQTTNV